MKRKALVEAVLATVVLLSISTMSNATSTTTDWSNKEKGLSAYFDNSAEFSELAKDGKAFYLKESRNMFTAVTVMNYDECFLSAASEVKNFRYDEAHDVYRATTAAQTHMSHINLHLGTLNLSAPTHGYYENSELMSYNMILTFTPHDKEQMASELHISNTNLNKPLIADFKQKIDELNQHCAIKEITEPVEKSQTAPIEPAEAL